MEKVNNNSFYYLSIIAVSMLIYLLNSCTAIYQCALMFSIISLIMNATTSIYGQFKALNGLTFAIVLSFFLLWELPYYIDGKIVNGLVTASFISLMISLYFGTSLFRKLYMQFGFMMSNILACLLETIIDGVMMGLFFIIYNNFPYKKVFDIFIKECSYKMMYAFAISAIIAITFNYLKKLLIKEYKLLNL